MIRVSINDETQEFEHPLSVMELLDTCGYEHQKVAVAINTDFVPRSQYAQTTIQQGDNIDVLAAVQGG